LDNLLRAFKALSNKNRLEIFNLLRTERISCRIDECCSVEGARCVTDIARKFNLAQSTVSHHLKELYNAGLIKMEKQGLWVYCSVNEETLKRLKQYLVEGSERVKEGGV
jgi:ArsR family transcriptional regulator